MSDELEDLANNYKTPPAPKKTVSLMQPKRPGTDKVSYHAGKTGVDENLVRALIGQESTGNPRAKSWTNEHRGLMQVSDDIVKQFVKPEEFGTLDAYNEDVNLAAGTRYLKHLSDKYKGDYKRVLAGYNAGEGNADKPDWWNRSLYWSNSKDVQQGKMPRGYKFSTREYIDKISDKYKGGTPRMTAPGDIESLIGNYATEESSGSLDDLLANYSGESDKNPLAPPVSPTVNGTQTVSAGDAINNVSDVEKQLTKDSTDQTLSPQMRKQATDALAKLRKNPVIPNLPQNEPTAATPQVAETPVDVPVQTASPSAQVEMPTELKFKSSGGIESIYKRAEDQEDAKEGTRYLDELNVPYIVKSDGTAKPEHPEKLPLMIETAGEKFLRMSNQNGLKLGETRVRALGNDKGGVMIATVDKEGKYSLRPENAPAQTVIAQPRRANGPKMPGQQANAPQAQAAPVGEQSTPEAAPQIEQNDFNRAPDESQPLSTSVNLNQKPGNQTERDFVITSVAQTVAQKYKLNPIDVAFVLKKKKFGIGNVADANSSTFRENADESGNVRIDLDAEAIQQMRDRRTNLEESLKQRIESGQDFSPQELEEWRKQGISDAELAEITGDGVQSDLNAPVGEMNAGKYGQARKTGDEVKRAQKIRADEIFNETRNKYDSPELARTVAEIEAASEVGWIEQDKANEAKQKEIESYMQIARENDQISAQVKKNVNPGLDAANPKVSAGMAISKTAKVYQPPTLQEILDRSGSFQGELSAREKMRVEAEEREKRIVARSEYSPLYQPLEFAKNFARSFPKGAASVLKTIDIAAEVLSPLNIFDTAVKLYTNQPTSVDATKGVFYGAGHKIEELNDKFFRQDEDLKNDKSLRGMIVSSGDTFGQVITQVGLGIVTGGASAPVLFGVAMGGADQYDEAVKGGAGTYERKLAAIVGGAAAVTDAIPFVKILKPLGAVERLGFFGKFLGRIFTTTAAEVGEKEAIEVTRGALRNALVSAWRKSKVLAVDSALEGTQELSEKKINDAVASATYDPKRKVFVLNNEDLQEFLGGAIGGLGGGVMEIALESQKAAAPVDAYNQELLKVFKFDTPEQNAREVENLAAKSEKVQLSRPQPVSPIARKQQIETMTKLGYSPKQIDSIKQADAKSITASNLTPEEYERLDKLSADIRSQELSGSDTGNDNKRVQETDASQNAGQLSATQSTGEANRSGGKSKNAADELGSTDGQTAVSGVKPDADGNLLTEEEMNNLLSHPNPDLNGKPIIAETADGKQIVANPNNKSGVSVLKPVAQGLSFGQRKDKSQTIEPAATAKPKANSQRETKVTWNGKPFTQIGEPVTANGKQFVYLKENGLTVPISQIESVQPAAANVQAEAEKPLDASGTDKADNVQAGVIPLKANVFTTQNGKKINFEDVEEFVVKNGYSIGTGQIQREFGVGYGDALKIEEKIKQTIGGNAIKSKPSNVDAGEQIKELFNNDGVKNAYSADLRNKQWEQVQKGETKEAGATSNLLVAAKQTRAKGGLQTAEEFADFTDDYMRTVANKRGAELQKAGNALIQKWSPAEAKNDGSNSNTSGNAANTNSSSSSDNVVGQPVDGGNDSNKNTVESKLPDSSPAANSDKGNAVSTEAAQPGNAQTDQNAEGKGSAETNSETKTPSHYFQKEIDDLKTVPDTYQSKTNTETSRRVVNNFRALYGYPSYTGDLSGLYQAAQEANSYEASDVYKWLNSPKQAADNVIKLAEQLNENKQKDAARQREKEREKVEAKPAAKAEAISEPQTRTVNVNDQTVTLTPEQNERWSNEVEPVEKRSKEKFDRQMAQAQTLEDSGDKTRAAVIREDANREAKTDAMQLSALKREISGTLTEKEQTAKDTREASNYIGKPVSVDGENGKVVGNPFGKVKVQFENGTEKTFEQDKISAPVTRPSKEIAEETQPNADQLDDTDAAQSQKKTDANLAKAEKIANKKPRSKQKPNPAKHGLATFVRLSGGIRPSSVIDTKSIKNSKQGKFIVNSKGANVEDAFRNAVEAGYFYGKTTEYSPNAADSGQYDFTVDDFVEAVAADANGSAKFYSSENEFEQQLIEELPATDDEYDEAVRIASFAENKEIAELLKKLENTGVLSEDEIDTYYAIAKYESNIPESVAKDYFRAAEESYDAARRAKETLSESFPESSFDSGQSSQSLYEEEIDESEPDFVSDDDLSFDFADEEVSENTPAPANISDVFDRAFDELFGDTETSNEAAVEPEPAAAPAQNPNLFPTNLFGESIEPTYQAGLFGAQENSVAANENAELETAYGKATADFIKTYEKSSDKDISRTARELKGASKLVAAKGANAALIVEEAANALDLFTSARRQKISVYEALIQPRMDGKTYSEGEIEYAQAMKNGRFGSIFNEDLSSSVTVKNKLADAAQDTGKGLDAALKGLATLFGDPNFKSLGVPAFDEKTYAEAKPHFTAAYNSFKSAAKNVSDAMRMLIQTMNQRGFSPETIKQMKPYFVRFIEDADANILNEVDDNAANSRDNLEPDSEIVENTVFGEIPDTESRSDDRGLRGTVEPIREGEQLADGDQSRAGSRSVTDRAGTDSEVQADESLVNFEPAGDTDSEGSRDFSDEEFQVDEIAADGIPDNAQNPRETTEQKREKQLAAEAIESVPGDLNNIAETLPFLFASQHTDVKYAEDRFAQERDNGNGVLFTNGTGTGKTFTGLGIAKRFAREGKDNILITVPSDKIAEDWINSGRELGLDIKSLKDTSSNGGTGIVITTYANFGQNSKIAERNWNLVINDESHYLMSNAAGEMTNALRQLRAISLHKRGDYAYASARTIKESAELAELQAEEAALAPQVDDDPNNTENVNKLTSLRTQIAEAQRILREKTNRFTAERKAQRESAAKPDITKVVMLSATPFAYIKNIEYADGYLYDYDEGQTPDNQKSGYNTPTNREAFYIRHFGYQKRYGRLEQPSAGVNSALMEMDFNEFLKKEKVLSQRILDVESDYQRQFIEVDSAVGKKIDEGLKFLSAWKNKDAEFAALGQLLDFDYLKKRYLLEAIKAKEFIPIIRDLLAQGKKVLVYHDYKGGGGFHPFKFPKEGSIQVNYGKDGGGSKLVNLGPIVERFERERPDLVNLPLEKMPAPIQTLTAAFPQALVFNGDIPKANRRKAVKDFNTDNSPDNLMIVQADAGREGISLHDQTGEHERVLINLGLPIKPTAAIQIEGRIYRVGQMSNAVFVYGTTGTDWERTAFSRTIADRASTAENLALGATARGLKDAFVNGFLNSSKYSKDLLTGTGGKESDRAENNASPYERAKSYYYKNNKKNSKNKSAEGVDYFATPEPIGYKMTEWLGLNPEEDVVEPSAGHGAIARFLPEYVKAKAIEPSTELRALLSLNASHVDILDGTFEDHHISNKYHGIAMNPPFGLGGKTSTEHLEKAIKHLRNGGRIVALLPDGGMSEKRVSALLEDAAKAGDVYKIGEIKLPGVAFKRAGTGVGTHILILEKQSNSQDARNLPAPNDYDFRNISDVNDLFDRLENIEFAPRTAVTEGASQPSKTYQQLAADIAAGTAIGTPINDAPSKASLADSRASLLNSLGNQRLKSEQNKRAAEDAAREPSLEAQAALAQNIVDNFSIDEFNHTKSNEKIFVAKLNGRTEKEVFNAVRQIAVKNIGYYSSYNGTGAISGFHFKSDEARRAFIGEAAQIFDENNNPLKRVEESLPIDFDTIKTVDPVDVIRAAKIERDGDKLKLNLEAQEILRRAWEEIKIKAGNLKLGGSRVEGSFSGAFYNKAQGAELVRTLKNIARDARDNDFIAEADMVDNIAAEVESARKAGQGTAVAYLLDSRLPHEVFHQASYLGDATRSLNSRHANAAELDNHPSLVKANDNYFSRLAEYNAMPSGTRRAVIREEVAAYIAGGESDVLGLSTEEAADYLLKFFDSYADKNGIESLDNFEKVSEDVQELVKQIRESFAERQSRKLSGSGAGVQTGSEQIDAGAQGIDDGISGETENGAEPAARGKGQKLRSLPQTFRENGLAANDEYYDSLTDVDAKIAAKQMLDKLGLPGAMELVKNIAEPDATHAQLAFLINTELKERANNIEDTDPVEAKALRERQAEFTRDLARKYTKTGQFISAARTVAHTATGVVISAQAILQESQGEEKSLTPEQIKHFETLGEMSEYAQAKLAEVQAKLRNAQAKIRRLESESEGKPPTRTGATNLARAKIVDLIKKKQSANNQSVVAKLQAKLKENSSEVAKRSEEEIDIDEILKRTEEAAHGFDEETLAEFAEAGAYILTEGIGGKPDSYLPDHFFAEMTTLFGDAIRPAMNEIYYAALEKRSQWINDIRRDQIKAKELKKYGDEITDEQVDEILQSRRELSARKRAVELAHSLVSGFSKSKVTPALRQAISETTKNDEISQAALILAGGASASSFYERLSRLGIDAKNHEQLLVDGKNALDQAKEKITTDAAKIREETVKSSEIVRNIEGEMWSARRAAQSAQESIAREFQKLNDGKILFYAKESYGGAMSLFRNLKATGEFSFLLKQGGRFVVAEPVRVMLNTIYGKATKNDFNAEKEILEAWGVPVSGAKSLRSEEGYGTVMMGIEAHPMFREAVKMGIDFSAAGKVGTGSKTGEEQLNSGVIEKLAEQSNKWLLPIPAKLIGRFDASMAGTMDALRILMYDRMATQLKKEGLTVEKNKPEFVAIARDINRGTGRPNKFENAKAVQKVINGIAATQLPFAMGYTVSHFQVIGADIKNVASAGYQAITFKGLPKGAQKAMLSRAVYSYGSTAVFYTLMAYALGGVVSFDTDDDDFLKIKVGKYRYDVSFGLRSEVRFIAKMLRDAYQGNRVPNEMVYDFVQNITKYSRNKLNVVPAFAWDALTGKDVMGQPVNLYDWKTWAKLVIPITWGNIPQSYAQDGLWSVAMTLPPEALGIGSNVYPDRPEEATTEAEKLALKMKQMSKGWFLPRDDEPIAPEVWQKVGDLKVRARNGENVTKEVTELQKSGAIPEAVAKTILEAKDQTFFEELVKAGKFSEGQLDALYKFANDEEKAALDKIKGNRAESKTKKENNAAEKEAMQSAIIELQKATKDLSKNERFKEINKRADEMIKNGTLDKKDKAKIIAGVTQNKSIAILEMDVARDADKVIEIFDEAMKTASDEEKTKLINRLKEKKENSTSPENQAKYESALKLHTKPIYQGRESGNVVDLRKLLKRPQAAR